MRTQNILQTVSIKAAADLNNTSRFIGFDGNYSGAGLAALGVLDAKTSQYEMAPVNIYGIAIVESGGAITQGAAVKSDSTGRAVAAGDFTVTVPAGGTAVTSTSAQPTLTVAGGELPAKVLGYALDAASGAGEFIRVKLG